MTKFPAILPLLLLLPTAACGSTQEPDPVVVVEPIADPPAPKDPQPNEPVEPAEPATQEPVPERQPWEQPGVRTAFSRAGTYLLKWRPVGGEVPKNKHFEIDLWLFKASDPPEPFGGAKIATRGWMPDHGHGMVRQPRSQSMGAGHYRIQGMLLHMGGFWQIFFDVVVDGQAESTQFDLTL